MAAPDALVPPSTLTDGEQLLHAAAFRALLATRRPVAADALADALAAERSGS